MNRILICILMLLFFKSLFAQEAAYTITEKDLIPEGITFDPVEQNFYISSILKNKIIRVSGDGQNDFIPNNKDGFMGGVGLHVDAQRRILWACSGNIIGNYFRTGVFAYDLRSGKLIKKIIYPLDTLKIFFNDLVIDKNGDVYITDTFGQCIWKLGLPDEKPLKIPLDGTIEYPNGIVISGDNNRLFVATTNGLCKVDLYNGKVSLLQMPDGAVSSKRLDGIAMYKNSIIGVQNRIGESRIARYYLNDDSDRIERIEVLDEGNKYFDIPTTLTIVKDELYVIANSQLDNLDQEKLIIKQPEKLNNIYILKYKLK